MSEQQTPKEKIKLSVSQIKADLRDGLDRKEIAAKYGLRPFELKALFGHPQLKGMKSKPKVSFELVDDSADEAEATAEVKEIVKKGKTPEGKETPKQPLASRVELSEEEDLGTAKETIASPPQAQLAAETVGGALKEVPSKEDDVDITTGQW